MKPAATLLCLALAAAEAVAASGAAVQKVGFAIRIRDLTTSDRIVSAFVMPRERLEIEVLAPSGAGPFVLAAPRGGTLLSRWRFQWRAPKAPGLHRAVLEDAATREQVLLHLFVLVPARPRFPGFTIGAYPAKPLRDLEAYRAPRGLVRVTPDLLDTWVSPHFRLGQFLCKQEGGFPKYLALQERLLRKLEAVLEQANLRGLCADGFHVMSGYRTPDYNRAIGNDTTYSRHLYGDAADIFVDDDPRDGCMDDLDGDGVAGVSDMEMLAAVAELLDGDPAFAHLVGGVGRYLENEHHGPFVHVDARGFAARW